MIIDDLKNGIALEVRPNSKANEYLEAVIDKANLGSLTSNLENKFGVPAKAPNKKGEYPKNIQTLVNSIGGLRGDQSFYYKKDGSKIYYAVLWPWASNPEKITLKAGFWDDLVDTDIKESWWDKLNFFKKS